MASEVKAIPEGHRTVTPYLTIQGASEAIAFYVKAFGAREVERMTNPDGSKVMHAELKIGDSLIYVGEECPEYGALGAKALGGSPVGLHLYVEDVDAAFERATAAGAEVEMPLMDAFWGDRYGKLVDPFGHKWSIATRKEDLTPEQMKERMAAAFAEMEPAGASV